MHTGAADAMPTAPNNIVAKSTESFIFPPIHPNPIMFHREQYTTTITRNRSVLYARGLTQCPKGHYLALRASLYANSPQAEQHQPRADQNRLIRLRDDF